MMDVIFRPRLAQYVLGAVIVTMVTYFVFLFLGSKSMPDYPFGFAAVIGGGNLLWNLVTKARKHGVRADATGVTDLHSQLVLCWDEIDAIRLDIEQVKLSNGAFVMRVATLAASDRKLRFADLGPGRPPRVGDIVNIETAAVLLAVAAARTKASALFPPGWSEPPKPEPVSTPKRFELKKIGGLGAMGFKLVPKIGAVAIKLVKSIKLGSVAIAVGAYSLIWSPQFALALVGMILVHECGHVFAMWRSGVHVRGIYFIPFFGGAAVSKGIAKTRANAAYIAVNGPIWGTILALGCFAAFAITERPFLGTLAAWGALINLFNLLPIFPLDGGRIVASLAHASRRGAPIVAATLVFGAVVAYFAKLELLVLVGFLGLLEFGGRLTAVTYGSAFALHERPLAADDHEHFARHVAYVELERDAPSKAEERRQAFSLRKAEAEQTPMSLRQGAIVLAGYALVVGVLIAILVLTANIAGSGDPLRFLY